MNNIDYSFLLGTHRSGTTWLGGLLGQCPGVAYWEEPRQVWTYRNWWSDSDKLDESDASPKIAQHIRRRFGKYAIENQATHFIEKTPSNCFRIPFMQTIFPDAKFVLLVRDGRAVIRSTDEILHEGANGSRITQRIRETSWNEYPAFLNRLPWLWQHMLGKPMRSWGVRPPGWRAWSDSMSPIEFIARQWSESIMTAHHDFLQIPEQQRFLLRYEDLVSDPAKHLGEVLNFLDLPADDTTMRTAKESCRPQSLQKWKKDLTDVELEVIRSTVEPTLLELGYTW